MYLVRYHELREQTSWKLRQTGLYHSYLSATDSNLFILLHPCEDSIFQTRLELIVGDLCRTKDLLARPLAVHELLFEAYSGNWRKFLRDKGGEFQRSVGRPFLFTLVS
jgi:hypothetical protein